MNKIELNMKYEFDLITCEKCGIRYVLLAVTGASLAESWMPQSSPYFCPYCGKKEEE